MDCFYRFWGVPNSRHLRQSRKMLDLNNALKYNKRAISGPRKVCSALRRMKPLSGFRFTARVYNRSGWRFKIGGKFPFFLLPANVDREYFAPQEVAYMHHSMFYSDATNQEIDRLFTDF